jgi:hypothetical protein
MRGRVSPPPVAKPAAGIQEIKLYRYNETAHTAITAARALIEGQTQKKVFAKTVKQQPVAVKIQPLDNTISFLGYKMDNIIGGIHAALTGQKTAGTSNVRSAIPRDLLLVAFASASCILDEYPEHRQNHLKENEEVLTFPQILLGKDYYQSQTFNSFLTFYHHFRNGDTIGLNTTDGMEFQSNLSYDPSPFYTAGTPENEMRELFNDLCDRARHYVDPNEITDSNLRNNWKSRLETDLKPDQSAATYKYPLSRKS